MTPGLPRWPIIFASTQHWGRATEDISFMERDSTRTTAQGTELPGAHLARRKGLKSCDQRDITLSDDPRCGWNHLPFYLDFKWITVSLFSPYSVFIKTDKVAKTALLQSGNATLFWSFFSITSFEAFSCVSLAWALIWQVVRTQGSAGRQYTEEHGRVPPLPT